MSKLVLNNITSGFASASATNANNDAIELAIENTLSRDGTSPNQMEANLDMNGHLILNSANSIPVVGFTWEGGWTTTQAYQVGDIVEYNGTAYMCIVAHTSGTFSTDLTAVYWQVFASSSLPSQTSNSSKFLQTDGATASWQIPDASESSFTQTGSSAVLQTVQTKLQEHVSILDFGATGDGVTDDSSAILLAITSSRKVYFPAGTYLISSALVITSISNFELFGDGVGLSTIKCHATDVFTNSALTFSSCSHFRIQGLTIDQNNNTSFSATYPLVLALSCTDFSIEKNEAIHFTYIGIAVNSCTRFWVTENRVERDTAINTTNHCINVSSNVSTSNAGIISKNLCKNSGSIFRGRNITIAYNRFDTNKYGAGVTTSGDGTSTYGEYIVTGNICSAGTGVDADGFNVAGMEIDGYYCTVNNNIIYQNAGPGIAMLAYRSTITGNICFGNGVGVGGAQYQAGIAMGYVSATQGAHYCLVSNNMCYDIGGGTQLYGYYDQSSSLVGITLDGNKFDGNVTGPIFLQGTVGYYETQDWVVYTPTLTSTTGTITTVGAVSGRYKRQGKLIFVKVQCAITTNGTGATKVQITLPAIGNVTNGPYICYGRENGVSGNMLIGQFLNGTQTLQAANYNDTYPGANNAVILLEGFYEVA